MKENSIQFPLKFKDVYLRYLIKEDIDSFIKWHVKETEWKLWDAPWEPLQNNPDSLRQRLLKILERPKQGIPGRLQICHTDRTYIGWVSTYLIDDDKNKRAVGIDISAKEYWGKGLGEQALKLWIAYLFNICDIDCMYCETWSGNLRMVKLAEKCGFNEIKRIVNKREVRGNFYDGLAFKLDKQKFIKENPELIHICP